MEKLECDNCGKLSPDGVGWYEVDKKHAQGIGERWPLHFCTMICLNQWAMRRTANA